MDYQLEIIYKNNRVPSPAIWFVHFISFFTKLIWLDWTSAKTPSTFLILKEEVDNRQVPRGSA